MTDPGFSDSELEELRRQALEESHREIEWEEELERQRAAEEKKAEQERQRLKRQAEAEAHNELIAEEARDKYFHAVRILRTPLAWSRVAKAFNLVAYWDEHRQGTHGRTTTVHREEVPHVRRFVVEEDAVKIYIASAFGVDGQRWIEAASKIGHTLEIPGMEARLTDTSIVVLVAPAK